MLLLLVLHSIASSPDGGCVQITATDTDPRMQWHCQAPGVTGCTNKHIACTPPALTPEMNSKSSKGLVIFLPGTYLQPQDYSDIVAEFAYHGFLSLGLFFPSEEGQNNCEESRVAKPTNLNCTAVERFKVLTGADNGGETNITVPDSIVNRAAKALEYVH